MVERDGNGGRRGVSASRRALLRPEPVLSQPSQRRAGVTPSQPPQTQRPSFQPLSQTRDDDESSPLGVSEEEVKKLVAEVMRHMLFKNHQQPNVPVRRDELARLITNTYKQHNLPTLVIAKAQRKMLSIFGFNMKEYVRIKSAKASKSSTVPQVEVREYVLESNVPEANLRKYIETPGTAARNSLAVVVVGIIKYSGGDKVPEETLTQNLERMGIREEVDHPVFGNIRNAIDTLSKQRYIHKEKLTAHDAGVVYELAERALDQSFQRRLDDFMTKIAATDNADIVIPV